MPLVSLRRAVLLVLFVAATALLLVLPPRLMLKLPRLLMGAPLPFTK